MSQHRDPLISVYISLLHGSTSPHTRFSRAASKPGGVRMIHSSALPEVTSAWSKPSPLVVPTGIQCDDAIAPVRGYPGMKSPTPAAPPHRAR